MTDDLAARVGIAALLLLIASAASLHHGRRQARVMARIAQVRKATGAGGQAGNRLTLSGLLRQLGARIVASGLLSPKNLHAFEQTLASSGFRPSQALPLFLGAKVALLLALPIVGLVAARVFEASFTQTMLAVAGMAMAGLLAPDLVIRRLRRQYLAAVERGMPDALDLLVICAEAGLPLETGLARVAEELRESNRPTSLELATIASEMKILPDRRQALINLGLRTGLDSTIQLGGTLAQTLQFGTPLTQALRVLAQEMRDIAL
ncbi:MAG: type II secretion system F family protein, partial [Acetobacteraceae bacterium]|nr:type II secretion system F family protein [Acetobacteraceae bacterium]